MNHEWGYVNFASDQSSLLIKFTSFQSKPLQKSFISAKIEAKNIYPQSSATLGIAPTSNQIVESIVYFDVTDTA